MYVLTVPGRAALALHSVLDARLRSHAAVARQACTRSISRADRLTAQVEMSSRATLLLFRTCVIGGCAITRARCALSRAMCVMYALSRAQGKICVYIYIYICGRMYVRREREFHAGLREKDAVEGG